MRCADSVMAHLGTLLSRHADAIVDIPFRPCHFRPGSPRRRHGRHGSTGEGVSPLRPTRQLGTEPGRSCGEGRRVDQRRQTESGLQRLAVSRRSRRHRGGSRWTWQRTGTSPTKTRHPVSRSAHERWTAAMSGSRGERTSAGYASPQSSQGWLPRLATAPTSRIPASRRRVSVLQRQEQALLDAELVTVPRPAPGSRSSSRTPISGRSAIRFIASMSFVDRITGQPLARARSDVAPESMAISFACHKCVQGNIDRLAGGFPLGAWPRAGRGRHDHGWRPGATPVRAHRALERRARFSPVFLVDPYPRTLEQIFSPETRARLEALPRPWHDSSSGDELGDPLLPERRRSRPDCAPGREAHTCAASRRAQRRGQLPAEHRLRRLLRAWDRAAQDRPVFGQPVAEMALDSRSRPHGIFPQRRKCNRHQTLFDEVGTTVRSCSPRRRSACRLRQPRPSAPACCGPSLPRARARSWLPDDALEALGVEPVGLVEVFAHSRVVFVLAPPTARTAARSARVLRGDGARIGGGARLTGSGRRLDRASTLPSQAIQAAIDVFPEEPIPIRRARTLDARRDLSAHRAGPCPRSGVRLARWWPTTSRRSSPVGNHSGCNSRSATVERLRSRPIG